MNERIEKVIGEIFETERIFVKNLVLLYDKIILPLKSNSDGVIDKKVFEKIFGSMNLIKTLHLNFLDDIKNCKDDLILFQCFKDKRFEYYLVYSQSYENSIALFKSEYENNNLFKDFMIRKKYDIVSIENVLISPIQRVMRYKLFLEKIKSIFQKYNDGNENVVSKINNINESIISISNICMKLNEKKKNLKHINILKSISKEFKEKFNYNDIISNYPQKSRKYIIHEKGLKCVYGYYKKIKLDKVDIYFFDNHIYVVVYMIKIGNSVSNWFSFDFDTERKVFPELLAIDLNDTDYRIIIYLNFDRIRLRVYKLKKTAQLSSTLNSLSSSISSSFKRLSSSGFSFNSLKEIGKDFDKDFVKYDTNFKEMIDLTLLNSKEFLNEEKGFDEFFKLLNSSYRQISTDRIVIICDQDEHKKLKNVFRM